MKKIEVKILNPESINQAEKLMVCAARLTQRLSLIHIFKSTNYADITLTVNVNATNKLVPTVTAPTANALTYNGAEQALVTAGKTTGGTMLYRLEDVYKRQSPAYPCVPFGRLLRSGAI